MPPSCVRKNGVGQRLHLGEEEGVYWGGGGGQREQRSGCAWPNMRGAAWATDGGDELPQESWHRAAEQGVVG